MIVEVEYQRLRLENSCLWKATSITNPESIEIEVRGHRSFDELSVHAQIVFGGFLNRDVFHMQNIMQLHQHRLIADID